MHILKSGLMRWSSRIGCNGVKYKWRSFFFFVVYSIISQLKMFIGLCSWMRPNVRIYGTPNFTRLLWMWSLQLGFLPCLLTLSLTFLSIPAIRLIADLAAEKKKNSCFGLNGTKSSSFLQEFWARKSDQNHLHSELKPQKHSPKKSSKFLKLVQTVWIIWISIWFFWRKNDTFLRVFCSLCKA